MYDRWRSLTAPWLWLVAGLALSAGLAACPPHWTAGVKQLVAEALAPGQRLALRLEKAVHQRAAAIAPQGSGQPAGADQQRLQSRIRELEHQLAAVQGRVPGASGAPPQTDWGGASPTAAGPRLAPGTHKDTQSGADPTPLIDARLVTARVLGHQARQFLSSRALLDVGSRAGMENGAVVLDPAGATDEAPLLDVGGHIGVAAGRLVLDARTVVGRLSEVGRHTSCLQRITDESYRDLVRIVQVRDGRAMPGPRGLLVGTGEAMCRVRMVDISQPVAVGDVVLADGLGGILSSPPRYGTIVRVSQSPGSAHWEILVQPDVDVRNLDVVSVLTTDISSVRVAGAPGSTQAMQ